MSLMILGGEYLRAVRGRSDQQIAVELELGAVAGPGCHAGGMDDPDAVLASLLERCRRDHAAWINGDGGPYALPADGSIMGAVGGASGGGPETLERQRMVASQWASGTGSVELVNGGVDGDLAWLAMIERATVVFQGDPASHRWDLRVTEVFRRGAEGWERVHRHADPLVDRHPVASLLPLLP